MNIIKMLPAFSKNISKSSSSEKPKNACDFGDANDATAPIEPPSREAKNLRRSVGDDFEGNSLFIPYPGYMFGWTYPWHHRKTSHRSLLMTCKDRYYLHGYRNSIQKVPV